MLVDTDLLEGIRAAAKLSCTGIHGNHTQKTKQSISIYDFFSLAHTLGRFQDAEMHKYVVIILYLVLNRVRLFSARFPLFSTCHFKIPPVTFLGQEFHIISFRLD